MSACDCGLRLPSNGGSPFLLVWNKSVCRAWDVSVYYFEMHWSVSVISVYPLTWDVSVCFCVGCISLLLCGMYLSATMGYLCLLLC
jgi:hypothetical protein